ncbi:formimidoylglutamase [Neobacillus notoginsengisoli]|uniref:Formimidoylglutamase n=1 Tax=Neobacillus notoginsengisoli TaxID=1578198 RepID=A0A417YSL9_9BACI|nr:formimidoylglutamase [Neobacillus notoginsengisoli]RHW39005.1 formimidoylglutamase [Neobacillus notoginsengisoli]
MLINPSFNHWQGRTDSQTDLLSFRYHQQIKLTKPSDLVTNVNATKVMSIIGFKCDEGVKRNKGRIGAAEAPDHIRLALAKLPWHLPAETEVLDAGDVKCESTQMEDAQQELGNAVTLLLEKGAFPIILGGGHETLYGHYIGARQHIGPEASLGIINIDAHFDMRPYEEETSSGTMFKQILDHDRNCGYFVAGIQQQGNTRALFVEAKKHQVDYILEEDLSMPRLETVKQQLDEFMSRHDYAILTLCTDAINSAYAPGVSAPSPFGLEPKVVRALIRHIVSSGKILSFDISEVNPSLDENNKTVTVAAHLLNEALIHFHSKK